jgi:hypothetical protein
MGCIDGGRALNLGKLADAETQQRVSEIIEDSFDTRPMPSGNVTRGEVQRRVEMAKDIYTTLLNECLWSEQRILDHLPAFLARGLDGSEAIPDWAKLKISETESAMWGAEAAGRVEPERRLSALSKSKHEPLIIVPGGNHEN